MPFRGLVVILGFTGTRRGMTPAQRAALPGVLATLPERVLHGGAVGADHEFDSFISPLYWNQTTDAQRLMNTFKGNIPIVVFPVGQKRHDFWFEEAPFGAIREIYETVRDPLERNLTIAKTCHRLLACPAESDEVLRSGTWATVRYARAAGKPITIIAPDGAVLEERR